MTFQIPMDKLKKIKKEGSNKLLSMYLNTDPSDPDQQGGKWKIQLKNSLRSIESYLSGDTNAEELSNFKKVRKKVEKFVSDHEQYLLKGIIIFASADGDVWFAECVQMRLETELFWEEKLELTQLEKLKTAFPRTGVILVQKNQIKVMETYLNEVEATFLYELNIDTEHWSKKVGPRKGVGGMRPGATNLQKDNFEDRFIANQQRWYKKIAPKLDKLSKDQAWEKIYLIGEREVVQILKKQMTCRINETIHKNMLGSDDATILAQIS